LGQPLDKIFTQTSLRLSAGIFPKPPLACPAFSAESIYNIFLERWSNQGRVRQLQPCRASGCSASPGSIKESVNPMGILAFRDFAEREIFGLAGTQDPEPTP